MDKKNNSFPIWPLILLGFLLILGWLGIRLWRTAQAAQALANRQATIESLAAADLSTLDPDAIETLILDSRRDILTIKNETQPFMGVLPFLTWLPEVGPMLPDAPHLIEMADAGTEAAAYAITGLKPALNTLQDDTIPAEERLSRLVTTLDEAEESLLKTDAAFTRFLNARNQIEDPTLLPWRVQTLLTQIDELTPLAQDGLKLAPILPELLGSDTPKRYLIIAQNEDELRPTGGFITGAGVITLQNGRILDLAFTDANTIDDWQNKPYEFPPQPLYDFMRLELFFFRDANYWPDFPTSAEAAMTLYTYGLDTLPLDGAIAIDQQFLKTLVDAVGPVPIPDEDIQLTANNLIRNIQLAWSNQENVNTREWVFNRKAFFETFAAAIRLRLETQFDQIDPLKLGQNMFAAAEAKHLQIYMRDPVMAATFDELGWNGRFPHTSFPSGDTLLVLDTNMGYSKANLYIERQYQYAVTLNTDAPHQATLTVQHQHNGPSGDTFCETNVDYYVNSPAYLEGADKCYWNYLRVYAPANATLTDSTIHTIDAAEMTSGVPWRSAAQVRNDTPNVTTFANFILLRRAQQLETTFTYQLPNNVVTDNQYHLTLYKQAGIPAEAVQFTLTLPPNTQLQTAIPTPTNVTNNTLTYTLTLDKDTDITVTYE